MTYINIKKTEGCAVLARQQFTFRRPMAGQPDDVPTDEYVIKIRPIILECSQLTIDYTTRDAKVSSSAVCIFNIVNLIYFDNHQLGNASELA